MTKIRFMSDLHLEFAPITLEPAGEDVLILAGDTAEHLRGFEWAEETGARLDVPVIYVAGNHEFYRGRRRDTYTMHSTIEELRDLAAKSKHVTFLEQNTVLLPNIPVMFCGTTLWTDFELYGDAPRAMMTCKHALNDYRLIMAHGDTPVTPSYIKSTHDRCLKYLFDAVNIQYTGKKVFITHHAPSAQSVSSRFDNDLVSAAYASRLDYLVEQSRAALWIHGHMHETFDYTIGETRVMTNPRGYDGYVEENLAFNPNLIVEV